MEKKIADYRTYVDKNIEIKNLSENDDSLVLFLSTENLKGSYGIASCTTVLYRNIGKDLHPLMLNFLSILVNEYNLSTDDKISVYEFIENRMYIHDLLYSIVKQIH